MSKMFVIGISVVLFVHGLIHLMGLRQYWQKQPVESNAYAGAIINLLILVFVMFGPRVSSLATALLPS